jgi:hypothetical protein
MDRVPQSQPLTVEEAKMRLREAAERASPTGYVRQHPVETMGLALVAGLLAGRMRLPSTTALMLAEQLLPFVIKLSRKP